MTICTMPQPASTTRTDQHPEPVFVSSELAGLIWRQFTKLGGIIEPRPRVLIIDSIGQRWLFAPNPRAMGGQGRRVTIDPEEWAQREVRRSGVAVVLDANQPWNIAIFDACDAPRGHTHVPTGDYGAHRKPLRTPLPGDASQYWLRRPHRRQWERKAREVAGE